MWICTQAFHVAKAGNSASEYEDAYFPADGFHRDRRMYRCAVADGATESVFSGVWAELLVRNFGRRKMCLKRVQRAWQRYVARRPSLPWYVQSKLPKGAHAALCGLTIRDVAGQNPPGGVWRLLAVGDSCVFQLRGEELIAVGPVSKSEDFDNSPYLLSTNGTCSIARHARHVRVMKGTWQSRDVFFLATDALAAWILAQLEAGESPWPMLRDLGSQGCKPFDEIVNQLRKVHKLKNDDSTLMRVEVA